MPHLFLFCRIEEPEVVRRFYMHASHNSCPGDSGCLVMVTKDTKCLWGVNCGDKPCFLYSKKNAKAVWSEADGRYHKTIAS